MSRKSVVVFLALCFAAIFLATASSADVVLGAYARYSGMGGAGLAVVDDPLGVAHMNPAAMGLVPNRTYFHIPGVDLRARGATLSDLYDSLSDVTGSDTESAMALAREFGSQDTTLLAQGYTGISFSNLNVGLEGQALAKALPNEAFRQWAAFGTLPDNPADAQATVTADTILYLPTVAYGWKASSPSVGDLYIGVRGKFAKSNHYSQEFQLNAEGDLDEMVGAETEVDDSGFAMDAGAIYRLPAVRPTTVGLSVTNFINPSLSGVKSERIISVGMATRLSPKVLAAADLIDITGNYEGMKLRLGAEVQVNKRIALRAGHTGSKFTVGMGLYGLNLAFSREAPLSIGQTLRF